MEIKLFYRTQRDLAATINLVIDKYWENNMEESKMIEYIRKLYATNKSKFIKEGQYTTILRQQCGKKRLEVVDQIINQDNLF